MEPLRGIFGQHFAIYFLQTSCNTCNPYYRTSTLMSTGLVCLLMKLPCPHTLVLAAAGVGERLSRLSVYISNHSTDDIELQRLTGRAAPIACQPEIVEILV